MKKLLSTLIVYLLILALSSGCAMAEENFETAVLDCVKDVNSFLIDAGAMRDPVFVSYEMIDSLAASFSSKDASIAMMFFGNDAGEIFGGSIMTSDPEQIHLSMFTMLSIAIALRPEDVDDAIAMGDTFDAHYEELAAAMTSGEEVSFSFNGTSGLNLTAVVLPLEQDTRLTIIWEFSENFA